HESTPLSLPTVAPAGTSPSSLLRVAVGDIGNVTALIGYRQGLITATPRSDPRSEPEPLQVLVDEPALGIVLRTQRCEVIPAWMPAAHLGAVEGEDLAPVRTGGCRQRRLQIGQQGAHCLLVGLP